MLEEALKAKADALHCAYRAAARVAMRTKSSCTAASRMVAAVAILMLGGCGEMDVNRASPQTASVDAITPGPVPMPTSRVDSTQRPAAPSEPTATPQPPEPTDSPQAFLPGVNADGFKEGLVDGLNATCRDGDGADDLLWTCSYQDEVAISFYGPRPEAVSAFRVVADARDEVDRRSWLRGYASIISVEVLEWVYDHVGVNETAYVGGVWVQITHDATSDGVLISAQAINR